METLDISSLPEIFIKLLRSDSKLRATWEDKLEPTKGNNLLGKTCMLATMLWNHGLEHEDGHFSALL